MTDNATSADATFYERLFERQALHVVLLVLLLVPVVWLAREPAVTAGELWGISGTAWFWVVIVSAIVHQVYVWLCWRLQLHAGLITDVFPQLGFEIFKVGFMIFGLSRWLIIPLAVANMGTLPLHGILQWGVSGLFLLLSGYLGYSVRRYFGVDRAIGLDHFDPDAHTWSFVEEGIFRYTSNGMYVFGFLFLWVPGLMLESAGALLAAAFHHAYIWVHYYCTEKVDMEYIYGSSSG